MFDNNGETECLELFIGHERWGKRGRTFIWVRSRFLVSSQLLAEFTRLPLSGFEGGFGVHQLVQLPANPGHVELGGLALLPEGGRLHPQLRGGHRELLAALAAL